ncbi:MAG: hypothetical protein ACOY45_05805 [Pseudomonadota bacterium]
MSTAKEEGMNEGEIAKLVSETMNWASKKCQFPMLLNFNVAGNVVEFDDFEGRRFRITVRDTTPDA